MYVAGYSLDNLSLMGLTVAVGFVVDDAIVMIENIVRYIEEGGTPGRRHGDQGQAIGFTIISITLSLCAVFIPLLFMSGIVGRLFREFAVVVTCAVMVSGFISLTLTPMMCSLFLKEEQKENRGRFYTALENFFDWLVNGYDRGLKWVFRHQFLTLLSTLALIVLTVVLHISSVPGSFFPGKDTGFVFGQAEARQDISFAAMSKVTNQFADIISQDPAVYQVVAFAGATGGNASENTARMMIQLKDFSDRDVSAQQVIQRLRPKVAQVEGAKFYLQAAPDVTVGGRLRPQVQYRYTA